MLRRLGAALGLVLLAVSPASAHLIEVTTSVAVRDAADPAALQHALRTAVDSALRDAIAFTPTLIVLTSATVVGERLYVRVLVTDQDGRRPSEDLDTPPSSEPEPFELRI